MFCTQCGSKNPEDARFCHNCGKPIWQAQQESTPTAAHEQAIEAACAKSFQVPQADAEVPPTESEQMEKYDITFNGAYFSYKGYHYDRLLDAINYAKLNDSHPSSGLYVQQESIKQSPQTQDIDFKWWLFQAWLGLTLGNAVICAQFIFRQFPYDQNMEIIGFILIAINSALLIMVLKFNKYAFLIATILTFNPIIWIINGIYLRNRWNHPKVNKK
jgi:hypothetical protein